MDREELETIFAALVNDPAVERLAWRIAGELTVDGDPPVHRHDLVAARPYLRVCVTRMGDDEARQLSDEHAAGLWARGVLGQARFRAGKVERQGTRGRGR
jgi:hypothetical protein